MSATAFQRMRREASANNEAEKNINDLKVIEIKALLDEKGIEYDAKARKEELVKLLEGAE